MSPVVPVLSKALLGNYSSAIPVSGKWKDREERPPKTVHPQSSPTFLLEQHIYDKSSAYMATWNTTHI